MSDFQTRFILAQQLLSLTAEDREQQEINMHKMVAPLLTLEQVRDVLAFSRSITPQIFTEMYTVEEMEALIELQTKFPQLVAKQLRVMARVSEVTSLKFEEVALQAQTPTAYDC
jgi:uncharacterized protein YhdP